MTTEALRTTNTANGKLRGAVSGGVASYKGVRYGASTAGGNRFLPPAPVEGWAGVRDALELGPQCPQYNPDFPIWVDPSAADEDCLVLNVWAPAHADPASRLPVMVWLHGGAYVFGSAGAPFYDGGNMALRGDVIVVGINHRLNIFGYTYLGDTVDERFAAAGNVGQLDIVAALRWVRENIGEFGGNPDNVTIFGQSGGGGKVSTLLAMDDARGLFHKAIVQSGSLLEINSPEEAARLTFDLYRALGLREGDVEALQRVSAQSFVSVMRQLSTTALFGADGLLSLMQYQPVVDGVVFRDQPWRDGAPANAREIPMIVGSNLDETVVWSEGGAGADPDVRDARTIAQASIPFVGINRVVPSELVPLAERYLEVMPDLSREELLVRLSTDVGFWGNAVRQCELKADQGGAPVFSYECQWRTPCFGGMWAPHGIELPFEFDRPVYEGAWDGADSEAARAAADPEGLRLQVGSEVFDAWMAFARTGDQSTPALAWPRYDSTTRASMVFDGDSRVVRDIRGEVREQVAALTLWPGHPGTSAADEDAW